MKNVPIVIEALFAFFILMWLIPASFYDKIYEFKDRFNTKVNFNPNWRTFLSEKVLFYRNLSPLQKAGFEKRIIDFINNYKIKGIDTQITDLDKVLVAASGVIPVFAFPTWYYKDLDSVYLFPDSFSINHPMLPKDTLLNGLVGYGGLKNKMYLSRKALYESFEKDFDGKHTGIHEFLHLIDMEDGEADGVPDILIPKNYIKPWKELIQKEIERVCNDDSILSDYACENAAEFFAESGVSFFENPEELQAKHPELYRVLELIFMTKTK